MHGSKLIATFAIEVKQKHITVMKKEIILLFTKRTGMSITEAKKKLKKEATGGFCIS